MKMHICLAVTALALAATTAHAQDSLSNLSKASGDSVVSTAELAEAGVKTVVGVVALPFVAVGTVAESGGRAVREGGEGAWNAANGPLDISPETVTAQPAPQVPYNADRDDRTRDDRDDRRQDDDRSQ